MRQSHLILSNAAVMWVTRALVLVPQLVLVPYLINTIGEAGFGFYTLIWSLLLAIDQLEKSLQSGVVKHSASFLAQGRTDDVNKIVSSSFVYSLLLALLASGAIMIAGSLYGNATRESGYAFVVIGLAVLVLFPLTPYIAIIQARQHYYVGTIAETISKYIGLLILVIWFEAVTPSMEALIFIMTVMLVLSRMAQIPIAYRLVPGLTNHPRLFDLPSFRITTKFGLATVLVAACLVANDAGIRWMMGILVSPTFVAHLAIMLMPGILMFQIVSPITMISMPAASAYEAQGNRAALRELLIRGIRYTVILVLTALLAASLLIKPALNAWVGPDYVFLAPYTLILLMSTSLMWSTSVAHHMLRGMGQLRTVVSIYFIALVVVPIVLLVAAVEAGYDAYVAVTVALAAGHVICAGLNMVFCARAVRADAQDLLLRSYAQPMLVAAPFTLAVAALVASELIQGTVGLLVASALICTLFLGACYFFITTTAERTQAKDLLRIIHSRVTNVNRVS